jgi:hypothetical protein
MAPVNDIRVLTSKTRLTCVVYARRVARRGATIDQDRDQHHCVMNNERWVATPQPDSSR